MIPFTEAEYLAAKAEYDSYKDLTIEIKHIDPEEYNRRMELINIITTYEWENHPKKSLMSALHMNRSIATETVENTRRSRVSNKDGISEEYDKMNHERAIAREKDLYED